jgi:hypothetical protein
VQSHPEGLNLVIGRVAPDVAAVPSDIDGWVPTIVADNEVAAPTQPNVTRGTWLRTGQILDVWGAVVFNGTAPTVGNLRAPLPLGMQYVTPPTDPDEPGMNLSSMACGEGYAVQVARNPGDPTNRVSCVLLMTGDGTTLTFRRADLVASDGQTAFSWSSPWGWNVGDFLTWHARVPLAPDT